MAMISVVVPVRNGAATLDNCLVALARQTADRAAYEVIVVNDGSTDDTAEIVRRHGLRCLDIAPAGPAVARNRGAAQARGELVLFTDGDCEPAPDWIVQMSAPFADPEVAGVLDPGLALRDAAGDGLGGDAVQDLVVAHLEDL